MRVLTIGSDRSLFDARSPARERIAEYAELFEELHVVVFAQKDLGLTTVRAGNLFLYPTNSKSRLRYMRDAVRLGKRLPADVVTAQDPFESGWVAYRIARKLRVPLQLQIHTDIASRQFSRSLLNKARMLLARFLIPRASCVRVVLGRLVPWVKERGASAVFVLPIYVDRGAVAAIPPAGLRSRYPHFSKIVVSAARLEPEKNVAAAVRAFASVVPEFPEAGFIVLNKGRQLTALQDLAQELGIGDRVVFEGFQDNPVGYYKDADALVQASWYEGYGMAVIEALAVGCPVVSTDVGIAREAGARIANEEDLGKALADVLRTGEKGSLNVPLRSKEDYLAEYKKLLATCGH